MIKNLAELKREIRVGREITKIDAAAKVSTLGVKCIINNVQTNAFTINGAWVYWGKSSNYEFLENGFSVYYEGQPHIPENLIGTYIFD